MVSNLPKGYYYKSNGVVNVAPSFTSEALYQRLRICSFHEVTVVDTDDENDGVNLSWSLTDAPVGMTISSTGVIEWTPTEGVLTSGQVTVSVADGEKWSFGCISDF